MISTEQNTLVARPCKDAKERQLLYELRHAHLLHLGGKPMDAYSKQADALKDDWEDNSHHLVVERDGCLRGGICYHIERSNPRLEAHFGLEKGKLPLPVIVVDWMTLEHSCENPDLAWALFSSTYSLALQNGVSLLLVSCRAEQLHLYLRMGCRIYRLLTQSKKEAETSYQLYLSTWDQQALAGSPLLPLLRHHLNGLILPLVERPYARHILIDGALPQVKVKRGNQPLY